MSIKNSFLAFSIRAWNERLGEMEIIPRLIFIDEQELLEDDDPVMSYMEQEVDEGKQVELDISGVLYRKEDIDNLMQWVEEVNYEPSERDLDIITELENNLNIYSEEDIAKSIDEDIAMESLAAFEGPFDKLKEAIKEKVGLATAKKAINKEAKRVKNVTVATNNTQTVFLGNEQKIKDDMARGGKAVPTALTDGQLMTYYIDYLRTSGAKELVKLYALLQQDTPLKANREEKVLLSEDDLPGYWDKIVTAEGEEELSPEAKNEKKSIILKIQQKIQARIKEAKQKGWVIAGYTMDDDLVRQWKESTSRDTVVGGDKFDTNSELTQEVIDKLAVKWDTIKKQPAEVVDKVMKAAIPKVIVQGRSLLLGYLKGMDTNPLIDWVFKLIRDQAKTYEEDIPQIAIDFLIRRKEKLEKNLVGAGGKLEAEGLRLSEGSYLKEEIKNKHMAQLFIIALAGSAVGYQMGNLKKDKAWKTIEEMNGELENIARALSNEKSANAKQKQDIIDKYTYYIKELEGRRENAAVTDLYRNLKLALEEKSITKQDFIVTIEGLIKAKQEGLKDIILYSKG